MSFKKIVALSVFISFLFSCKSEEYIPEIPQIIPVPSSQILNDGYFVLDDNVGISYSDSFKISGDFLRNFIKRGSDIKLDSSSDIQFVMDETIENPEGYILKIEPYQITINAKTDQGAFYAVQSLRQLLPAELENNTLSNEKISIQCMTIIDAPKFQYRGMHLDVGRHMFSVEFIKSYIDALALLKMNTFHWHLTEDQGWRIEIKAYPKLQSIAAYRNETLIGHYSDQPHQFDKKRYGGYYTQSEIKDIVAYAGSRHVTVIPEIELPGHAQAAIAAYPNLGCTGEQVDVATKWGVFEHIYCSKDETFEFLETVLDEVITLFPSRYIHIGGDEAPKTKWKTCGLAPNATVMSWRGTKGAVEAAKQKHNVIMTPTSHCYFDYYQSTNPDEPIAIGGFLPLEKVYDFNPIPVELNANEAQYVLGAQGNIWTEYIPTEDQVEYMAFPRILAMSEVVWSKNENKNYLDFAKRIENFNKRLDLLDVNYANHLYEIEGELISKNNENYYKLSTKLDNKAIYFTEVDGGSLTSFATIYESPILIKNSTTIKAAVFEPDNYSDENRLSSIFSETINLHKGVGQTITINKAPHKSYSGSGPEGLINGISGSDSRYGDKEWLGFWGEDIELTINFNKLVEMNTIKTRFHNGNGQWIYAPNTIELKFVLDDGSIATDKATLTKKDDSLLIDFIYESPLPKDMDIKIKSITLKIPNYGTIPDGKQGAGQKAWTFIDEIIVH